MVETRYGQLFLIIEDKFSALYIKITIIITISKGLNFFQLIWKAISTLSFHIFYNLCPEFLSALLICLSRYQHHTVLLTITLKWVLFLVENFATTFHFQNLTILAFSYLTMKKYSYFYMNFRISFKKNPYSIFIRIKLMD